MRKLLLSMLLILTLLLSVSLAATLSFDDFSATVEIPDTYLLLTPSNLASQTDWLSERGTTAEETLEDWNARGVRFQAWSDKRDVCVELTAVQDDLASTYYDVNECTEEQRKEYRLGHSSDKTGRYSALGYDYSSAQWKNAKNTGRFLVLKYKRNLGSAQYEGYARKTVRNGYSIHLEYQVYGRSAKSSDSTALDKIMNTWNFTEIFPRPASSTAQVIFTAQPPEETNTGKFTLKGTGSAGLQVIAVSLRMLAPEPIRFETEIKKNGKFELDITLPEEGVWMTTYAVLSGDTIVQEGAFNSTTKFYDELLVVNLDGQLPTVITGDSVTISGKTMKQTNVQCLVEGRYNKSVRTNNSGEFSFKIDTSAEGEYRFVLVFEKKNYETRRITSTATRTLTDADKREDILKQAVKPAYSTLRDKLTGYTGRYMVYTLFIDRVEQAGDQYLTYAAMRKIKGGGLRDLVVVTTDAKPAWAPQDEVRMVLQCTGAHVIEGETDQSLPAFDFLFTE